MPLCLGDGVWDQTTPLERMRDSPDRMLERVRSANEPGEFGESALAAPENHLVLFPVFHHCHLILCEDLLRRKEKD